MPERDSAGRFIHWDRFERLCTCGHKLGIHTAAKVNGQRDCCEPNCPCLVFKPSRRKRDAGA
jgi:hypothetical protein